MSPLNLSRLFDDPQQARSELVERTAWEPRPLPNRGSSFFIHLSELCPVACEHCMYSSDMERKSAKDSLEPEELETAIGFINATRSEKLNITGGGEPFLKPQSILRLLETVQVPRIEIVTAGYWGKSENAARRMIDRLVAARRRNPGNPELLLRLSIDRYHINAPKPVLIEHYGNVAAAWAGRPTEMLLGFRSIQPDRDYVDRALADHVGGRLTDVDEWNRRLTLPNGRSAPITFNVFRVSGKASRLSEGSALLKKSKSVHEYYGPFERREGQLVLATAVNDAIRGSYTDTEGLAITMNSDGRFWIFCGTSPDRQLVLGDRDFAEAIPYFFQDPITRLLVDEGVWALADIVAELDPMTCHLAIKKNDVAALVEDLLASSDIRLAVTLITMNRFIAAGRMRVNGPPDEYPFGGSEEDLIESCRNVMKERSAK